MVEKKGGSSCQKDDMGIWGNPSPRQAQKRESEEDRGGREGEEETGTRSWVGDSDDAYSWHNSSPGHAMLQLGPAHGAPGETVDVTF